MYDFIVVGAGAAGCFAAAVLGQIAPHLTGCLLEKTCQPLAKVKISGGGRCNVTHHCFDIEKLMKAYPRGSLFLRSAFHRFQPEDMISWLQEAGVELKVEADGRMFPKTNTSQTIVDLFLKLLRDTPIHLQHEVTQLRPHDGYWELALRTGESLYAKRVLYATGGNTKSYPILEELGHRLESPVPSLFTVSLEEKWILELAGSVAPAARVSLGESYESQGPLLITHWGFSGPAILKLSAFAARWLSERNYKATVTVNWTGMGEEEIFRQLQEGKKRYAKGKLFALPLFSLSKNLWKALLKQVVPTLESASWAQLSVKDLATLSRAFHHMPFTIVGKSLNKEEFVTAGGVCLDEIHPKTMESRKQKGLYFSGEVLDVDGITGGFNFQNAWTGSWIAAHAIAASLEEDFSTHRPEN